MQVVARPPAVDLEVVWRQQAAEGVDGRQVNVCFPSGASRSGSFPLSQGQTAGERAVVSAEAGADDDARCTPSCLASVDDIEPGRQGLAGPARVGIERVRACLSRAGADGGPSPQEKELEAEKEEERERLCSWSRHAGGPLASVKASFKKRGRHE